jgi:hypothetical protein
MKVIRFIAQTNSPYESHCLITAMFGKNPVLFLNNYGNFIAQTDAEPNLDNEFVKKHNVAIREHDMAFEPTQGETVQFNVKFCALTKAYERNPKSWEASGNQKTKNGIMLGDKEEAREWLKFMLEKHGAIEINVNIDLTECWDNGKNRKIIVHSASGFVKINESDKFMHLLQSGIGNSKYLGLGLVIAQ